MLFHAATSIILLLNEIGRYISGHDEKAISCGAAEHLATQMRECIARPLFVSHFHELNYLADVYRNAKVFHLHVIAVR